MVGPKSARRPPTTPPRVTAIIPTYNWSSVLPYSIGSVLRQSFTDWELLVVGDGCTDDSETVVGAVDDPRVTWVNLPSNTGHQCGPNNEGVRQARGDLIAYLGHDDLWLVHHLALLVAALDDGADLVYGITEMVAPGGARVKAVPQQFEPYGRGMWIPPTGVVHRRAAILAVGGWRNLPEMGMDPEADLWARMSRAGAPFAFVPRLTAVKFSAAARPDVYRLRPSHEQAAWLARIDSEPDFEATELARMLVQVRPPALSAMLRRRWFRLWRRLGRSLLGYDRSVVTRRRRVKGLEHLP